MRVDFLILTCLGLSAVCAASADHFCVGGATFTLEVTPTPDSFFKTALLHWITSSAQGVTAYYGHFPVARVLVQIRLDGSQHIGEGVTYAGRRIEMNVGRATPADAFLDDWEMTHELLHLALPLLDEDYDWVGEGFSDYLEPIIRVRNGTLTEERAWQQLVEGFPKGLPGPGDQGLDETHTWGRTYWGGALYWFLADIEIRRQTNNKRSLQDVARAFVQAGGTGQSAWEFDHLLEIGDRATGTVVLKTLHAQLGHQPYAPDLVTLWKQLGIRERDNRMMFDDDAPLASFRRSIMKMPTRLDIKT